MARKDEQNNSSQFDTGFGSANGTFGGSAGGAPKSQSAQGTGGEFSSGFGGGTNAVSQIFRDGGMGGDDKRRKIMMGLILGVSATIVVSSVYYFVFGDSAISTETPTIATTPAPDAAGQAGEKKDEASKAVGATDTEFADVDKEEEFDEEEEGEEEELVSAPAPSASATYAYNEKGGGPLVSAPAGTAIEVSRMQDFSVMYMTGTTNAAGQLRIPNPPAGKVYWRVSGKTESNEIAISPAPKLNIGMQVGASIAATDTLQWSADGEAAHYRLEFAGEQNFGSITFSFSTNKKQVALSGVTPGNYFVRVGGLNVASGRWEFTRGSAVEVK
ncbi:MAG: hypothetical protein FJY29_10380 [Betaproteobacteria bacterium]|nr:hypothetical protein [Betaproteobacteria bacterium]